MTKLFYNHKKFIGVLTILFIVSILCILNTTLAKALLSIIAIMLISVFMLGLATFLKYCFCDNNVVNNRTLNEFMHDEMFKF